MRARTASLSLLAAGMVVGFAFSGRPSLHQQEKQILRYDAAAIVKLVAVRVLGPDGRPVTGLRKEDFTLFEDDKKKTITEFEVHTITGAGMVVTPQIPSPTEPTVRPEAAMNRRIFIFLDLQGSDAEGKIKAQNAAIRFLDTQTRPGDEAGVLGFYAMSGFFIKQYLTTDMKRVRRTVLEATEAPPSPGEVIVVGADDSADQGRTGGTQGTGEVRSLGAEERGFASAGIIVYVPGTAAFQRGDFVSRMADVAEVFKTIPGNKSLILFTSRDLGAEAGRLGRLFGATGTAVYAVNTQDWMPSFFGEKVKHIWLDHSLKDLSAASGGKYFADINDPAAIAQDVQDLTGNFYVLGYYVQESYEGKYHSIRIEVDRPEVRVLSQAGYADPKPFRQMSNFEKEIQLIDLAWADRPVSNFTPIAVDPLFLAGSGGSRVCLLAQLEISDKIGVPPVRNEVFAFLRDQAGTPHLSRRWEVNLSPYGGKSLCAYVITSIPAGAWEFRLVVRDLENGVSCIGRAKLDVPAIPEEGILLSTPLLFEKGAETPLVRLPAPGRPGTSAEEPSLTDLYRMIPKDSRLIVQEIAVGSRRLTVVLPFDILPPDPEDIPLLALEAKLLSRPDGHETPLEMSVGALRRFEGSPDILVAEIALPLLSPGDYDLKIDVEDVGTDRHATIRKAFSVR